MPWGRKLIQAYKKPRYLTPLLLQVLSSRLLHAVGKSSLWQLDCTELQTAGVTLGRAPPVLCPAPPNYPVATAVALRSVMTFSPPPQQPSHVHCHPDLIYLQRSNLYP